MTATRWSRIERWLTVALLLLLAALPLGLRGSYFLHVLTVTVLYACVAQSWNLLGGYAGQLSIGHIMYFGVGAYVGAVLWTQYQISPWLALPAAAALAACLGLFVSFLSLRYGLRLDYYALLTLAGSQVLRLIAVNLNVTGGAEGIYVPVTTDNLAAMQFTTKAPYYVIALAILVGTTAILALIQRAKMGAYLVAIRENEAAAEALGVDTARYKALSTVLSAALTAVPGVVFAVYTTFIDPDLVLGLGPNFEFLLVAIVGGRGTLFGPILGAMLFKPLAELVRTAFGGAPPGFHLMVFGAGLAGVILFVPQGLAGAVRAAWSATVLRRHRRQLGGA